MRPRTLPPDRKARLVAAAVFVVLAVSLVLAGYGYYRIDNDEILADARHHAGVIGLVIALLLLLSAGLVAYFYRLRQTGSALDLARTPGQPEDVQETYRLLFESMNEGCAYCQMLFDERGKAQDWIYLSVNGMFEQLTGLKGVIGKRVSEVIPGIRERDAELFETYVRVSQSGKPERLEIFVEALQQWFSISVFSHRKDFFAAVFDDITDRKAAEERLLRSEEEFHALAESMPQIVWATRPDGWNIYFNHQWMDYTGLSLEQSRGHGWNKPFHPDDQKRAWDAWQLAIQRNDTYALECRLRRADGAYRWFLIRGVPLLDADGKILKWFGTCTDIEDIKQGEKALRESREKLHAALGSMTDAVFISDNSGQFIEFNNAFASFHRFQNKDDCAKLLSDYPDIIDVFLPNGELAPLDMWAVPRALRGETVTDAEYSLRRKDTGETWTGSYSFAPIRGKTGEIVGSVVVGRDITAHKAAEARILRLTQLYAALSQSNQAIVRCSSPEELLPTICRVAVEFGGMKMAWISRVDEATGKAHRMAAFGSGTEYLDDVEVLLDADDPLGCGPTGIAIREGRPVWCQNFQNDPSTAPWHKQGAVFGWRSSAAIPLVVEGKTMGALTLYSDTLQAFDEDARNLLIEMAGDISFGWESFIRRDARMQAEEAVRQSRNMLAKVLDSVPQAVFWKDLNSVYMGCNDVYERILGLGGPEEIVGKTDFDFQWTREDAATYIADDRAVMECNRAKLHMAETVQNEKGIALWFDTSKLPLTDSDGRVYGVLGVFEDITERKRAEEELQNLRTAVEQSANTVVITDTNGKIEYVNPAFEKSTGYTAAEALGNNPRVLKSGEQAPAFYQDLWKTITCGETWRGEFHNRRKDGSLYWESATISPVHNGTGEIVHFIAVKEDITARKEAEAALVWSEVRFRTIIEKSPVPMAGNDKELNITFLNPAFVRLFGYSHEEIPTVSHWWPKAYPSSEYRERVSADWLAELERAKRTGTAFSPQEVTVRCKDGADKTVLISATQLSGSPDDDHVVVVIDITERKMLESNLLEALELAEAGNRSKSEFLAIMSHELRTPLNGVLGFAELLAETPLDADQKDYTHTIRSCGEHLLQVVNDILDFSSLEKGSMKFERVPVAVADLLESSCLPSRKTALEKGLELRCELDPRAPKELIGDSRRLCQILINLIANAVKFTAGGSVVLRVALASGADRPCLDFSVQDTGIGMSPETIDNLFKPFTQADSKLSRRFEGAGLGLAISQRLAEVMGGTITVASALGQGSTFTFRLPVDAGDFSKSETDTKFVTGKPGSGTAQVFSGNPVLVVEDDSDNASLAGKMLEALGYQAKHVANGQEALDAFRDGAFSAILMDMQMPVMDGLSATRKIRELEAHSGTTRVPIIALTANVLPTHKELCIAAGMDDFLSKPFKKDHLAAKLARFLPAG